MGLHDFHAWGISWEKDTVRLGSMELNTVECYEAYDPATCCLFAGSTAFKLARTTIRSLSTRSLLSSPVEKQLLPGNTDWGFGRVV